MKEGFTYRDAGVDVQAGYRAVEKMKAHVRSTATPGVLSHLGSFGGLFRLDVEEYQEPILVSGTDGVGTKLKIAFMTDVHNSVGIDLVAMCANDVLCHGAKPLFFLDYIATGQLDPDRVAKVVEGVADGCRLAGCALIGGETAEMPDFYAPREYDLAGFCVGVVDRSRMITGEGIQPGDLLIGLPSTGLHSNGFSLVRKLFFQREGLEVDQYVAELGGTLGEVLLTPTRIYVKPVLALLEEFPIKGIAHVTGGGFFENIPRILPEGCGAEVDIHSFPKPAIFTYIQELGSIEKEEMYATFNMGIGMVLTVEEKHAQGVLDALKGMGEEGYIIGRVAQGRKGVIL